MNIIDIWSIPELFNLVSSFLSVTTDYFTLAQTCKCALSNLQRNPLYHNLVNFNGILGQSTNNELYFTYNDTNDILYNCRTLYTYLNTNEDVGNIWFMRLAIASKLNHPVCRCILIEHSNSISHKQIIKALIKGMVHGAYDTMQIIFTESKKLFDPMYFFNLVTYDDMREDDEDEPYYNVADYPHKENIKDLCKVIWNYGFTDILQFLFDYFGFDDKLIRELCESFFMNFPCSNLLSLKWLHNYYTSKFQQNLFELPNLPNIPEIIGNGLCENFMWYYEGYQITNKPLLIFEGGPEYHTPFENACSRGTLDMVKLLYTLGEANEYEIMPDFKDPNIFWTSMLSNNIDITKYIYGLVDTACREENIPNTILEHINGYFEMAIRDSEITTSIKSFLMWTMEELKIPISIDKPFRIITKMNNNIRLYDTMSIQFVEIHKYYESKYNNDPSRKEYNINLCSSGTHLVIEYIIDAVKTSCIENLFMLCMNSGLDIPDLHANNDEAFRSAIKREDFGLAFWLIEMCNKYELGHININANNDEAFRSCCGSFKTHEQAKWLYQLSLTPPYVPICVAKLKDQIMTDYKGKMRRMLEKFLDKEFD